MAKIVLASGSPRRQELLRRMGITDFTVRVPEVEEYFPAGLTPEETVCYISREKSQAVASGADEIVITADTMVFLDDKKLGKPADEAEALQMLTALQGRRHTVCTGVTVRQGEKALTHAQHTDVYFRPATQRELKAYIAGASPWTRRGLRRTGTGRAAGRAHRRRLFQRDEAAGGAAGGDAGRIRDTAAGIMPLSLPLRGCAAASPAGGDFREEQTTHEAIFYENGNMAAGRGGHHRHPGSPGAV